MDLLQPLAKAVIHALFGDVPGALAELGAPVIDWLHSPIRHAVAGLEGRYREFEERGIDPDRLADLLDEAAARVKEYRLPWRKLTDLNLDAATIAAEVLRQRPFPDEDGPLLTEMLTALYRGILDNPQAIEDATGPWRGAVLKRLDHLEDLLAAQYDPSRRAALAAACAAVLRTPGSERPAPERTAAMLRAEADLVPLTGRDQTLAEIRAWCEGDGPTASVRLYTGPGGTGKTRLFREVCRALPADWTAGFLDVDTPTSEAVWRALTETRPLLVVVDYADHHEGKPALASLLRFAPSRPGARGRSSRSWMKPSGRNRRDDRAVRLPVFGHSFPRAAPPSRRPASLGNLLIMSTRDLLLADAYEAAGHLGEAESTWRRLGIRHLVLGDHMIRRTDGEGA